MAVFSPEETPWLSPWGALLSHQRQVIWVGLLGIQQEQQGVMIHHEPNLGCVSGTGEIQLKGRTQARAAQLWLTCSDPLGAFQGKRPPQV